MCRRDLGENNAVKREHLDVWKTALKDNYNCELEIFRKFQKIIDKIEHKLEDTEKFLKNNTDEISLSYYTKGYYNGRARAMEDIIDTIEEVLNEGE